MLISSAIKVKSIPTLLFGFNDGGRFTCGKSEDSLASPKYNSPLADTPIEAECSLLVPP